MLVLAMEFSKGECAKVSLVNTSLSLANNTLDAKARCLGSPKETRQMSLHTPSKRNRNSQADARLTEEENLRLHYPRASQLASDQLGSLPSLLQAMCQLE